MKKVIKHDFHRGQDSMVYQLWDKERNRYLTDDECGSIGVSYDGSIIEYGCGASSYGDVWLTTDDVTDKYEIHINNAFLELSK